MKIMVSACLLGQNCKYSGGNNYSKKVEEFVAGHEVIPVCPEVAGGLPVPRTPCEIVNGTVTDANGISRDREFRNGAAECVRKALDEEVELAVLQPRSPSCGSGLIYDGTFSGKLVPGDGIFVQMLKQNGIKVINADELEAEK